MKTGRNAPCPCGSGKKYKKCCLRKAEAEDFSYRRLGQVYDALVEKLMHFTDKELPDSVMDTALDEFLFKDASEGDAMPFEGFSQLFVPWSLFTRPLDAETLGQATGEENPQPATIAGLFARLKPKKLEHMERKVLEAADNSPLSFCEILSVEPGKALTCRDLFRGTTHSVFETAASKVLAEKDVFYCSLTKVDEIEMLLATSPVSFPPEAMPRIEEQRTSMGQQPLDAATLLRNDAHLRKLFLELHAATVEASPAAPAKAVFPSPPAGGKRTVLGQAPADRHQRAMQDPNVLASLGTLFREHWKKWTDLPAPALDGKTPREAVQTPQGREKVEAMLEKAVPPDAPQRELQLKAVREARKLLGL